MKIHPVVKLIVKLKMTKRAFAELLDIDESTLWRWQKDKKPIPAQHHLEIFKTAKKKSIKIKNSDLYV